jgi:ribosomal protein S18 acetylase RimI-like enzyme
MTVRRATKTDVDALVRLRVQMFVDMDRDVGQQDTPWRVRAAEWFAGRIDSPDFAAFVVDDPELGVVSVAAGTWENGVPGPHNVAGGRGHVFNVSTDPRCRRRGFARLCVTALLDWFDDETDVAVVGLSATDDAVGLYTSLGFEPSHHPELRRRRGMLVS